MKKILVGTFALAMAAATLTAAAQTGSGTNATGDSPAAGQGQWEGKHGHMGKRGHHRMGRAMKELNLSDAQKSQMKTIRENAKTQAQSIKGNTSLSQDQKRDQLKQLHESTRTQMEGVLTAEQKQKLEDMKKQHAEKRGANAEAAPKQ
jgi:Spy/CpxP family protein refolding chaperone